MKIVRASAINFGSYKNLLFDFAQPGLHIISGPTGAGKSTLCDLIPWTLFGVTAKNGIANDILAWNAEEDTKSSISVQIGTNILTVVRQRGKVNDLYFHFAGSESLLTPPETGIRGKDLKDTQLLINRRLRITAKEYLLLAYYHEFGPAATFFMASASDRRHTMEHLLNLAEVKKAQDYFSLLVKSSESDLEELRVRVYKKELEHILLQKTLHKSETQCAEWDKAQNKKIAQLEGNALNFDCDKAAEIDRLSDKESAWDANSRDIIFKHESFVSKKQTEVMKLKTILAGLTNEKLQMGSGRICDHCGSKTNSGDLEKISEEIAVATEMLSSAMLQHTQYESSLETQKALPNPFSRQIELINASTNVHIGRLRDAISNETNPYLEQAHEASKQLSVATEAKEELEDLLKEEGAEYEVHCLAKTAADKTRGVLVTRAVHSLEIETNSILASKLDSGLQVQFQVAEFEKLEVTISKDGNEASFSQLSKGQRQMLRLAFSVSCMRASSRKTGVTPQQIFLDEPLDGLDDGLKIKAFGFLEELTREYESVFVIEHNSDIKNMTTSKFEITLKNGYSQVRKSV